MVKMVVVVARDERGSGRRRRWRPGLAWTLALWSGSLALLSHAFFYGSTARQHHDESPASSSSSRPAPHAPLHHGVTSAPCRFQALSTTSPPHLFSRPHLLPRLSLCALAVICVMRLSSWSERIQGHCPGRCSAIEHFRSDRTAWQPSQPSC